MQQSLLRERAPSSGTAVGQGESDPSTDDKGKGGPWLAMANYCKALFGAGVLALPNVFDEAGLVPALMLTTFLATSVLLGMWMLLQVKFSLDKDARRRRRRLEAGEDVDGSVMASVTYTDVCRAEMGRAGAIFVQVTVIVLQLLFCTGFVIVMAHSVTHVFKWMPFWVVPVAVLIPVVLMSWITWLRDLWWLSMLGLVCRCSGSVHVLCQALRCAWGLRGR